MQVDEYLSKNIIKNTYIDSYIKNDSGSDSIGRNHYDRFRNSTKIHLIIDNNRMPINYAFTGGNVNDITPDKLAFLKNYKLDSYKIIHITSR